MATSMSAIPQAASMLAAGCWVVAVGLGLHTQADAWSRVTPDESSRRDPNDGTHLIGPYPDVDALWARIPEGSVVLAPQSSVSRQLPAHGLFTVAPQWPSPGVTDTARRSKDQAAILASRTPPESRQALIEEYGVTWVIWPTKGALPAWLDELGIPVDAANGQRLFQLP